MEDPRRNRHPTPAESLAMLRSRPGINITKQPEGAVILVETSGAVYELTVLDPTDGLIRIASTERTFHRPKSGILRESVYEPDSGVVIPRWIGPAMRMRIGLKDCMFNSSAVMSAQISGRSEDGRKWYYDVF